jgi:hypothetical protein
MTVEPNKSQADAAGEAYSRAIKRIEALHGRSGASLDVAKAQALAKNIIGEELGAFGHGTDAPIAFVIDETRRDKLLANAREDIAMLYSLAVRANEQLYELSRLVTRIFWLLVGLLFVVVGFHLWDAF